VDIAATVRTGFACRRKARTSAIVYLPVLRSGSATSSSTVRYATSQPTEYMKPS
jgi:hypothetical protein